MNHELAVIFDMDGVIIDNNAYHEIAWKEFLKKHHIELSEEEFNQHVFGRIATDTLNYVFKREVSPVEVDALVEEKEAIFKSIYVKHIKAVDGLIKLLEELKKNQVQIALATSAPPGNIDFTFEHIPIQHYFSFILNASHISRGKPDPEIYLKAIEMLSMPPNKCLVFEDSKSGIQAASVAGARVVGLSTTHAAEELNVEKVIQNFNEISYSEIYSFINDKSK